MYTFLQSPLVHRLRQQSHYAPVIPSELQYGRVLVLDMNTSDWRDVTTASAAELWDRTQTLLLQSGADLAIGQYAEERNQLYQRYGLFVQDDSVSGVHLGIDLMVHEMTPVYAPLAGRIHSFANHNQQGDYGPTLILKHCLEDQTFFTLYGHLSQESLNNLQPNKRVDQGALIGYVGRMHENGLWPPHLHFQIIEDLLDYHDNFPGVVTSAEKDRFLSLCPDPNLILRMHI